MKIQNRAKICLCISIVIMLVAVVMSLTGHGINYGIDFAGGLNLQYDMGSAYDKADVEEALKAQGIEEFVRFHRRLRRHRRADPRSYLV